MNQEALNWIVGHDTGTSSKTIWAVMMGSVRESRKDTWDYDIPHDADDFGRCYRLIKTVPEWRDRLEEVGDVFPKWKPIIRLWDDLVALYDSGKHKEIYDLLRSCHDECMELAGYIKTGEHVWERV